MWSDKQAQRVSAEISEVLDTGALLTSSTLHAKNQFFSKSEQYWQSGKPKTYRIAAQAQTLMY